MAERAVKRTETAARLCSCAVHQFAGSSFLSSRVDVSSFGAGRVPPSTPGGVATSGGRAGTPRNLNHTLPLPQT